MPGPGVVDGDDAVGQADPDGAVGRAPLGGVVEQVGQRPLDGVLLAVDEPRRGLDVEGHARARGGVPGPGPGRGSRAAPPGHHAARRSARRGPARPGRRSGWSAPRSGRGRRRAARRGRAGGSTAGGAAWASRSMLVRSEVSGVRSSCPASATSWRCRSREAPSAVSTWLNDAASRAISSSPSTGSGVRSSVRAISSTAAVRRRTGRRPLRATPQPATGRPSTPARPKSSITMPERASTRSWRPGTGPAPGPGAGRRPRWARRPRGSRRRRPVMVRMLRLARPRATASSGRAEAQLGAAVVVVEPVGRRRRRARSGRRRRRAGRAPASWLVDAAGEHAGGRPRRVARSSSESSRVVCSCTRTVT